jgi:hypothetical protein
MDTLPNDAVRHIVSYISIPQRIEITRVSKRFLNSICYHDSLWRNLSLMEIKDILTDDYFQKLAVHLSATQNLDIAKCKKLTAPWNTLELYSGNLVSLNLSYIPYKVILQMRYDLKARRVWETYQMYYTRTDLH